MPSSDHNQKSKVITILDKKKITSDYLMGMTFSDLEKNYGISQNRIKSSLSESSPLRSEIEKKNLEFFLSRENKRIELIKERIYDFFETALMEAVTAEEKLKIMDKVSEFYKQIDNTLRLNLNKATSISETTDKKVIYDVAQILKEMKSPEDKKAFLLNQMQQQ